MNRREALQSGLSILAAAGIDGEVATLSPVNPKAFVITMPRCISCEQREKLSKAWADTFNGTSLASVPVIIMQDGMTLSVIDAPKE